MNDLKAVYTAHDEKMDRPSVELEKIHALASIYFEGQMPGFAKREREENYRAICC